MIDLYIQETRTTPEVKLSLGEGKLSIKGKSFPENAPEFYFPLIRKVTNLVENSSSKIELDLYFDYFNTSSSKCIFNLLRDLKKLENKGCTLNVKWNYEEEDEDMKEIGEDYEIVTGIPFTYNEVSMTI